ncbi:D-ribose ABC transporter substrate-binding protein [Ferruginibacter sp. SUN106]|uniref:D-ribose ABC transporter substrate-binding protein n=1 Tax=Ferruginibacter sp. SUN106 TaxID=2978348 RepID=UPI003D369AB5
MKRFSFLLLIASVFIFSACNNSGGEKKKAKKMAIVVSTLNNPWFVFLAQTAEAKAKALGYETKVFDSQNNTATETDNFENILVSDYCAILFNPTDADGSVANVKKAKEAGVPVFCIDREINAKGIATSQILSDGYSGSVEIAKYFVDVLNKKGTYVELLGITGDNNTKARSAGFHSVVDNYPDMKMVAQQSADFDRNKGMEVMESMLQAHPDITGVFCGNDAMAMGAYQALVGAGKDKTVKVFGFDGADDAIKSIKENKLAATGMQFPKIMAEKAAEFADEYYKGKRDFPEKIPVAVELVTAKNVDAYMGFGKK